MSTHDEEPRSDPANRVNTAASPVSPASPVMQHINFDLYKDEFADVGKCRSTGRDVRICYNIFGDRSHPCILLIQGLDTSLLGFSLDFINILVKEGYCVIRYDNRDVGLSTQFDDLPAPSLLRYVVPEWLSIGERLPYTLRDMMEDGMGLLTALGIEKAHIFGLSMGGMLAQLMAIHYPQRVLTLNILFSHMGGKDHIEPPLPHLIKFLEKPKTDSNEDKIDVTVRFIKFLSQNQYSYGSEVLKEYFKMVVERNGKVSVGHPRQVSALQRSPGRRAQLKKVTCPTLIMHGMLDPLIPVKNGYMLAETIPNSKLIIFPRLGHIFPPKLHHEIAEQLILNFRKV